MRSLLIFLFIACMLPPAFALDPPKLAIDVVAPTVVCESPQNEAVCVRLPDDTLRIFFILRPSGDEVRSIESADGGISWRPAKTEFKLPGPAYYAVQVLVDQEGELQAVFHVGHAGSGGYAGKLYDVWHTRTTAGRTRWRQPTCIHEGYTGSLRGFTELRNGRLVLPLYVAVPKREKPVAGQPDYGWSDTIVLYSDDHGASWIDSPDRLKVLQDETRGKTRYGAVEPNVVQLLDGRVWMLIRTKNGHLYESLSADGARWSAPAPSLFISSDSPAATVRLRDGRLVLFFNACQRWDDLRSYAIGGRDVLHAGISSDDGKTWQGFREVLRDPGGNTKGDRGTAYPAAVETHDGKILLVAGQGDHRRFVILLDPKWLSERSQSDDFSSGLQNWTTYDGVGAELVHDADQTMMSALQIRKIDAKSQTGAVWNFPAAKSGSLALRIKVQRGSKGVALAITDHFSVVGDTQADAHAVYRLLLKELAPDQWHVVKLEWDATGNGRARIDAADIESLPPHRSPAFGLNYLRLSCAAPDIDEHGFLVAKVASESNDAR